MRAELLKRRCRLAHLPTPLWHHDELDRLVGAEVWVKRDDMSSGAAAGNKIRKLEYLLAAAQAQNASTVITCGGLQSNHARATALLARELGMDAILYLRTAAPPSNIVGNVVLDLLAGAEIRLITPDEYASRDEVMASAAARLSRSGRPTYVIPEGGSNGLGALGYVTAIQEIRSQLDLGLAGDAPFDAIVHACGSGGTAAGCVLAAREMQVASTVYAFAVCDDSKYFESSVARIVAEARGLLDCDWRPATLRIYDEFKGPAYAVASPEQLEFLATVTRRTGLVLDPVYSGKALFGLAHTATKPARILFLHTGGLPGLLAQSDELAMSVSTFRTFPNS